MPTTCSTVIHYDGSFLVLTCNPLHPDDIVLVFRRRELLQVVTVVGFDAVCVVAEVLLVCMEQEVLHHVRHLHFLKHGKEDALGHAADPGATVQGAVCPGLPRTLRVNNRFRIISKLEVNLKDTVSKMSPHGFMFHRKPNVSLPAACYYHFYKSYRSLSLFLVSRCQASDSTNK